MASRFTRQYKLYGTWTTTATNIVSLTVPRDGTITAIAMAAYGIAPADSTGRAILELSTSSVTTVTQNDTPGNSMAHLAIAANTTSTAVARNTFVAGMAQPVSAGDKLYIHVLGGGTAFASGVVVAIVTIQH